jgi:hypothetical protein
MNITLEAIRFNHDPTSAAFDALNIRKNEKQLVNIPEWRRGITINPEESPAAYSLFDTRGNEITIRAKFKLAGSTRQPVEIRALNQHLDSPTNNYFTQLATHLIDPVLRTFVGGPLGDVQSRWVTFNSAGETDYEIFILQKPRLWELGVGVHDITWRWQYRLDQRGTWTDFDKSRHRIYIVLRQPQEPWQQTPVDRSNIQLPWTEVLEYACRWAATSQNPTDAARRITHNVYQLGSAGIARYCQAAHYIILGHDAFKCAKFLSDLRLGSMRLNCTDCGTIVSTFVNILGGELWQSETNGFDYNPVLRIGESQWHEDHFNFHVLAWEGDCDIDNNVFDACLQVDGDHNPTNSDDRHVPLLPVNIRFGGAGEQFYSYRLVAPCNPPTNGQPRPEKRLRRTIQTHVRRERDTIDEELLEKAMLHFAFDSWQFENLAGSKMFLSGVALEEDSLPGWILLRRDRFATPPGGELVESLWRLPGDEDDKLLLINVYEGVSVQNAREWLLHFLASLHSFEGVRKAEVEFADAYFILGEQCGVVFALNNLVVFLGTVGRQSVAVDARVENFFGEMSFVPSWEKTDGAHEMSRFKPAQMEYKVGVDIPLLIENPDPFAGLPLTYKFVTDSGFIHSDGGELNYRPLVAGTQEVRVFAANRNGGIFRQKLQFDVS